MEMKLYVKTWCPWCVMAREWLKGRGYNFVEIDVQAKSEDFAEMRKVSGQSRAPVLTAGNLVLADFGPPELELFLKKHAINP